MLQPITILGILPSVLLAAWTPAVVSRCYTQAICVQAHGNLLTKLSFGLILFTTKLMMLSSWKLSLDSPTLALAVEIAACAETLLLSTLLYNQHSHERRPSSLMSLYITFSTVTIGVVDWLRWSQQMHGSVPALSLVILSIVTRFAILILHEQSKWALLYDHVKADMKPRDAMGMWNRMISDFGNHPWAIAGFNEAFTPEMLQDLGPTLRTHAILTKFEPVWNEYRYLWLGLMRACVALTWETLSKAMTARLLLLLLKFAHPLLIYVIIQSSSGSWSDHGQPGQVGHINTLLILATVLIFSASTLCQRYLARKHHVFTTSIKSALVASVFKKLATFQGAEAQRNAKLSLISTDIDGVLRGIQMLHGTGGNLFNSVVYLPFLWYFLGRSMILVIATPILFIAISTKLAGAAVAAHSLWRDKTQKRLTGTTRMLKNITAIKMTNRERVLQHLTEELYEEEFSAAATFYKHDGLRYITLFSIQSFMLFMAMSGEVLNSQKQLRNVDIARMLSCLVLVVCQSKAALHVIQLIQECQLAMAYLHNIQTFLNLNTVEDERLEIEPPMMEKEPQGPVAVRFDRATVSVEAGDNIILWHIEVSIALGSFTLVTGAAGAGKSTFLNSIVGQSVVALGQISVITKSIGYCGQEIWLENDTIRRIIVGPMPFDPNWYLRVLEACGLLADIAQFPTGDQQLIGRNGVTLNSSQRQRVAVARAVYLRSRILVLDDFLAAQGPASANRLLLKLFGPNGLVSRETTVIIATSLPFPWLDIIDSVVEIDTEGRVEQKRLEDSSLAMEAAKVSYDDVGTAYSREAVTRMLQLELATKEVISDLNSKVLSRCGEQQASPFSFFKTTSWKTKLIWLLAMMLTCSAEIFHCVYIRVWLEHNRSGKLFFCFWLLQTVISGPLFAICYYWFYAIIAGRESRDLHHRLLQSALSSPISIFDATTTVNLIELFSEAFRTVSQELPMSLFLVLYGLCLLVVYFALFMSLAPIMVLIILPMTVSMFALVYFYQNSAKQLQQMNLEATTALYSHFTETASGTTHINALRRTEMQIQRSNALLNSCQRIQFNSFLISQRVETCQNSFNTLLISAFVAIALITEMSPYKIGLGIFVFPEILSLIDENVRYLRSQKVLSGSLGRIQSFIDSAPREEEGQQNPALTGPWMSNGSITFERGSIFYKRPAALPIIGNITLQVQSGQEVGIWGAAESGKSALLYSLLNLIPYTGSIKIDGREVRDLPRHAFEGKVTILPQEPVVFPLRSVRENLMMEEIFQDRVDEDKLRIVLEHVLDRVGLLNHIYAHGDMLTPLEDMQFSPGQLQRFSMAQALVYQFVHRCKIFLIDGATSNVDRETRQCMQRLIKEIFPDCTIITVAHHPAIISNARIVGRIEKRRLIMGRGQ